jgi:flagellar hook-length control protein FliK
MTVESSTTAPATPSTPTPQQRGKASAPGASGLTGFFALLSAADSALATPLDTETDGAPGKGRPGKGGLFGDTEVPDGQDGLAALSLLGAALPAAPDLASEQAPVASLGTHSATPTTALPQHSNVLAQDADAAAPAAGAASTKKPVKSATTQLADDASKSRSTVPGKDAAPQKAEPVPVSLRTLAENMPVAPVERAQAATQFIAGERRAPDQQGQKSVAAGPVYFQPQASSAPMGMDGVVATGAAAPMDTYVAEQVSYWITQDVQNAEMTLDGVGQSPVEVSISMQGNEAQVAFHTDESAARQALEDASEQLRDMLQRQGLVLAGVTVGNAQTGDSGQQQGRPRQDARRALVASEEPVRAAQGHRASGTTGGAVDLFV